MKRTLLLSLFACLSFVFVWGQGRVVTGRVTKENSTENLAGVSVTVKGTSSVTTTNNEGSFTITVPAGSNTLVFTSVGFRRQEVNVEGKSTVAVAMAEDASALSDVVVVGYTSVRRKDITGSVSSVTARQLKDVPLSNAAEAIQGRLAGVSAVSSEGAPGADIIIRVRGGSSITQDNSPLYIVDGVVVENALSVIAPQDIASIDVLKDASTTAIYGARAANGVVVITTKSGRPGKTIVSYNGSVGVRKLTRFMDVLNPYDFVIYQYERSRGSSADSTSFAQTYGTTWDTLSNYKNVPFINWQERVFGRSAKYSNQNVAVSGGTQNTTFNLSLTANNEEGIQLESGFDRYLVNFKLDQKISDKFKIGFSTRYLDQTIKGVGTTNSGTRTTNRLRHTINYRPFELSTAGGGADEFDEAYYLASAGATNPVLLTQAEYRRQYTRATYFTGYLNYNILKNLVFRSTIGYDFTRIQQNQFFSKITSTARNYASLPVASIGDQNNNTLNNSNTLQYTMERLGGHHDLSFLIGQEIVDQRSKGTYVETRYFPADISAEKALNNMGLGSAPTGSSQPLPSSFENPPARIFALFGRISYNFDDKYLATFNLRSDRSSKFSPENGSLLFPSGSLAWRFSREKFMEGATWMNEGKLRIGYGSVGNNRIPDLLYQQLYGVTGQYAFNHAIVPGFAPIALANPNLRWEANKTLNLGLDLAFLRNRIQLTVDAYRNVAKNLLLQVAIPPTTGYTSQYQNVGSTENKGLEFQLNTTPVQKRDFSWNSNFNMSFNRNKVLSLGGVTELTRNSGWQGSDGVDDYIVRVGEPMGLMYGFVNEGYYQVSDFNYNPTTKTYTLKPGIASNPVYGTPQPGMLKWRDLNGDSVITADKDRTIIGNANPKFTGGWYNQLQYKAFDLSVFVNFVVGNDIYNANKLEWTNGAFPNTNMLDIMKNRFTNINSKGEVVTDPAELEKLNAGATIWRPVTVQRWWLDSWAVEDGSYLRINNVTLGYTLPKTLLNKAHLSQLRVYTTVNNLATLTNYTGYDPDVTARRADPLTPGVDFAAYPRARTWVVGLNVSF